jgi:hypothetical protein
MARRSPETATAAKTRPSAVAEPMDDALAPGLGERLRQLALGLTTTLVVMRPYWPSEDAATGSGLSWVLALLGVAAVAIIAGLLGGVARGRRSWADAAFLLLVLLVGLSATHAGDRRGASNLAWEWGGLGIAFLLVRNLPRTRDETAMIAGALVATAVAVAAYGLYQGFVELPALKRAFLANAPRLLKQMNILPGSPSELLFRQRVLDSKEAFATFALANSLAGFLVGPLVFGLAVAADNLRREGRGSRDVALGLAAVPGAILLACLLLTKSRSAWAGLVVGGLVIAWRSRGRISGRAIGIGIAGLAVTLGGLVAVLGSLHQLDTSIVTESTKSLRFRWEYWRGTWDLLTNAPSPFEPRAAGPMLPGGEPVATDLPERHAFWTGLGPGNFAGAYLRHKLPESSEEILDPHNMVLEVWTTAGLPAVVVLLAALGLGLWQTLRPLRASAGDEPPSARLAADAPPRSAAWLIPWGAAGWAGVVIFGKLNPFQGDLFARWVILGVAWVGALALGWPLWRRRPIAAAGAGAAVLAVAINLMAAGGIGIPSVALGLWLVLALGLNLRDDLPCGTLRERRGIGRQAVTALVWAGAVGAFWGAIGPYWRSEMLTDRGEAMMERRTPQYELAREVFLAAAEADRANMRPRLDLAELEFAYWKSPAGMGRPGYWQRVFVVLDNAIQPKSWRDEHSLHVRRLQAQYARLMLQALRDSAPIVEPLVLKSKIVSATRNAARLYPTSAAIRAQLAQASADLGDYADALAEAEVALKLSALTPHLDKKLPELLVKELEAKIPEWTDRRDHPPVPPPGQKAGGTKS